MRLKPAGIIVIVLVIAVLAYFAISPRLSDQNRQDNTATVPTTEQPGNSPGGSNQSADNVSTNAATTAADADAEEREFNYTPEKPENGALRGVVEVGATGFNSFVINMDNQKRWEIVSKDFGQSLAYEGLATTEDIREGLKKYLSMMFDKGVNKRDMHFVISSGAQKEPKTATISNELQKLGYVVNNVSADQEARYGFNATVPPAFADNSFMVDIGSGNTKVSWQENGNLRSIELPGAKYYEKGTADEQVYNQVKSQMSKVPESKRNVGFIIGGVPYTLANQHRKGEERYTVLRQPQSYKSTDKKMASGLNIYRAIVDATGTDTFVFDWDANFTIGFFTEPEKTTNRRSLMSFLKQLLTPFVEFDENKKKEQAQVNKPAVAPPIPAASSPAPLSPAVPPADENAQHPLVTGTGSPVNAPVQAPIQQMPTYSPSGILTGPLPEHEQYFERLIEEANAKNPVFQGPDYKEFVDSKLDIDDIQDEALKYKTAYNILKNTGLTKEKLLSTGQEYLNLIGRDLNAFQSAHAGQYQKEVRQKEQLIQKKAEELQALSQRVNTLKTEINQHTQDINLTKDKLNTTKNSFLLAGENKQKEIQTELQKIAQYF